MLPIQPALNYDSKGVTRLQEGLHFILDKHVLDIEPNLAKFLCTRIPQEMAEQFCDDASARALVTFLQLHRPEATAERDTWTAAALNRFLRELGALDDAIVTNVHEYGGSSPSFAGDQPGH